MTALPAKRLGWTDRGVIAPGHWADVVVFNPKTVIDKATFFKPHQHSIGVDDVIVRGRFVLKAGKLTGARPGRPIKSVPTADSPRLKPQRRRVEFHRHHTNLGNWRSDRKASFGRAWRNVCRCGRRRSDGFVHHDDLQEPHARFVLQKPGWRAILQRGQGTRDRRL